MPTIGAVMSKLHPERLLVPSQQHVRAILARYTMPLTRFAQATSGVENLTLIVWSERKTYVLRVYPQQTKSDAAILRELDFMAHLRTSGLPVPAIRSSSDSQPFVVCEFGNQQWQSVLMEHARGAHPTAYTPALLDELARLHARMHILGEQYAATHTIPRGRGALRATDGTTELLKKRVRANSVRDFLMRVTSFVVELDDSLPTGLCHLDYDIENVLTKNDGVTAILDFGDMECMPLVVCLGYTLCDVLFETGGSPELVARYVQQYQQVRQLNHREKAVVRQIMLFRHYMITAVDIQFSNISHTDVENAIQQEQYLRNVALRL
jgi:Ser/Thr protein kinase RdoA (MazF antagonist)